jgi:hypothetical protein
MGWSPWGDLCAGLEGFLPVALSRAGRAMLPTLETRLKAGDLINVSATYDGISALRARLGDGTEG